MSYDVKYRLNFGYYEMSQSLWNRAVSYDMMKKAENAKNKEVSIPLEQGSVLRQ